MASYTDTVIIAKEELTDKELKLKEQLFGFRNAGSSDAKPSNVRYQKK